MICKLWLRPLSYHFGSWICNMFLSFRKVEKVKSLPAKMHENQFGLSGFLQGPAIATSHEAGSLTLAEVPRSKELQRPRSWAPLDL